MIKKFIKEVGNLAKLLTMRLDVMSSIYEGMVDVNKWLISVNQLLQPQSEVADLILTKLAQVRGEKEWMASVLAVTIMKALEGTDADYITITTKESESLVGYNILFSPERVEEGLRVHLHLSPKEKEAQLDVRS